MIIFLLLLRVRRIVYFKKFIYINVLVGNVFFVNIVLFMVWGCLYWVVFWDFIMVVRCVEWFCVGMLIGIVFLIIIRRFFRIVKRVIGIFWSINFILDRIIVLCYIISIIVWYREFNFWWWIVLIEVEVICWFVRIFFMFKDCYFFILVFNICYF